MSAQIIPMMRFKTGWLMLVLAVGIIVPTPSSARGLKLTAFGFRVGVSAMDSKADFKQYEILLISGPLWSWRWSSGWGLDTRLNATVGALRGGGRNRPHRLARSRYCLEQGRRPAFTGYRR